MKMALTSCKKISELSGQNNEFLPLNEVDSNIKEFKSIEKQLINFTRIFSEH